MARLRARIVSGMLLFAAVAWLGSIAAIVLGAPQGLIGYRTAFETLRLLAWAGLIGAIVSIAVIFLRDRIRVSPTAPAIATLMFAIPVAVMILNEASPPPGDLINDITTDLEDPPQFSAVIPLRPAGSNPVEYGGPAVAARQREAYPEIAPIYTPLEPEAAFQKAFETAEALGWEIVSGDLQSLIIEAIDTTRFFRFKDDIVIRIRAHEDGSRVDLRSRSRVGRSDLGKNAKRIGEFTRNFSN